MILILQFQIQLFHFFLQQIVLFLLAEDDLSVLLDFLLLQVNLTEQGLKMAGVLQALAVVLESFDAELMEIIIILDYFVQITDESGLV